jgi:phage baseplate assembly protein W
MANLSPKFPLFFSADGSYASNSTIKEVVKQNFKNLVLTTPGERIMNPDFGVGLRNYLFEQNSEPAIIAIRERLVEQVQKYMSFIQLQQFSPIYDENQLIINIQYFIIPISATDILSISV